MLREFCWRGVGLGCAGVVVTMNVNQRLPSLPARAREQRIYVLLLELEAEED